MLTKYNVKASTYLDIGCGDGILTLRIAKAVGAREIYGVVNRESILKLPPQVKGVIFDLEKLGEQRLPFKDCYFDLITAVEVIEHLSYGDHLLMEVYRLLKSSGHLLITTPNLASWVNRLLLLFGIQPMFTEPSKYYWVGSHKPRRKASPSNYGHKNLYTLRALKQILSLYGFNIHFDSLS